MIKERQKTVYSLIISQLRYDGFTDISTQLEDYTCIQTRAKNHLDKLVESVEYQWKITSFFADNDCIPTLLSKNALKDGLPRQSFASNSLNAYCDRSKPAVDINHETEKLPSKFSSNNINEFDELNNWNINLDAKTDESVEDVSAKRGTTLTDNYKRETWPIIINGPMYDKPLLGVEDAHQLPDEFGKSTLSEVMLNGQHSNEVSCSNKSKGKSNVSHNLEESTCFGISKPCPGAATKNIFVQNQQELLSDCEETVSSETLTLPDAVKVKIIKFIHHSSPISRFAFVEWLDSIALTRGYSVRDIISEVFGENFFFYVNCEYNDGIIQKIFLKKPWKSMPLINILRRLHLSHIVMGKDNVRGGSIKKRGQQNKNSDEVHGKTNYYKATDFKPCAVIRKKKITFRTKMHPQKQKLFLSHRDKLALIEVLLKQDSYTFKDFLCRAISAVPNIQRNHTVKEIVTALFSSQYSNYLQFLHNEKENRIFLKPSWKGKTSTEVLNATNKAIY